MNNMFNKLVQKPLIAYIGLLGSRFIPPISRLKKYKNILKVAYDINKVRTVVNSNPIRVRIAPTSVCNYRCLFCEIHKDNLLYPNRSKNLVGLDTIKNYESFLATAYSLSFYGGSEEPLLAPRFGSIVKYVKGKYKTKMMVNTNASVLNKELADIMVEYGFDSLLISYHAGTKESYKQLMTGNIDKVDKNIFYLQEKKRRERTKKPLIRLNLVID